jgi:hypothetical protein
MALNSSGKISLAGSTAGESVALELGKSATGMISMNDTVVRALAGISTGVIQLDDFYGKSSESFWIACINGLTNTPRMADRHNIDVDAAGNLYVSILTSNTSNASILRYLVKLNPQGQVLFSRVFGNATNPSTGNVGTNYVYVDNVNSWYYLFDSNTLAATTANTYTRIRKFDLNGNFISTQMDWHKPNNSSTTQRTEPTSVTRMENGNILVTYGVGRGVNVVYNSDFTSIVWRQGYSSSTESYSGAIIPSTTSMVNYNGRINKFSYTGALEKQINPSSGGLAECAVTATSAGVFTIYRGSSSATPPETDIFIKLNNNLDFVSAVYFQKTTATRYDTNAVNAAFDSSGNIYAVGCSNQSPSVAPYFTLYKLDSNLNVIWQRAITISPNPNFFGGTTLALKSQIRIIGNSLYINTGRFVFKLNTNGSGTGTYSVNGFTVTYSALSLAAVPITYALTTTALWATPSIATGSISQTDTNVTLTASVQNV